MTTTRRRRRRRKPRRTTGWCPRLAPFARSDRVREHLPLRDRLLRRRTTPLWWWTPRLVRALRLLYPQETHQGRRRRRRRDRHPHQRPPRPHPQQRRPSTPACGSRFRSRTRPRCRHSRPRSRWCRLARHPPRPHPRHSQRPQRTATSRRWRSPNRDGRPRLPPTHSRQPEAARGSHPTPRRAFHARRRRHSRSSFLLPTSRCLARTCSCPRTRAFG